MKAFRSLLRVAILALVLGGLQACAKPRADNPFAAPGTGRGEGSIRVRVENQNFGDAVVYAVRGGERVRLGDVTGKSDRNFTMRWNFSLPLEFEVNIIGSRGCRVRPMSVSPGDQVWMRIPTQIDSSPCYSGKS